MYEEYFGLRGEPFKLNPDPKFFFGSKSHNKAMAYLHYGLKQAEGFIVITGPIGAGKSMLIGHLLDQLDRSNIMAATLLTSNIGRDDLLGHILSAFRIEPEGEGAAGQIEAFEDFLFDQLNRGRRVLLAIDEAQNLPKETLEELRVLSNMAYEGTPLFQVFLIGQPEFRETVDSSDMEQLRQRVIASYHLERLSEAETREYILHRLSVANWQEDPGFTDEAFSAIYRVTNGLPRRINKLCNRIMLHCSIEKIHEVTESIVEAVIVEMRSERSEPDTTPDSISNRQQTESQGTVTPETSQPVGTEEISLLEASSVFDRLAAKRQAARESSTPTPAPQEATLSDIAAAIATAGDAETNPATEARETGEVYDKEADEESKPPSIRSIAEMARELRGAQSNAPALQESVVHAVKDTRDELRRAQFYVSRLRRKMTGIDKRRVRNRTEILDNLTRAEALLKDIRNAWR